jgi:hypothetical protein
VSTGTDLRQVDQRTPWRALRLLGALLCVAAAVAGVVLLGGKDSEREATGHAEPGVLEHVDGESLSRVVLTPHAAQRLGIETSPVRTVAKGTAVPYAALIYDPQGETWVYTSPERLVFVRAPIEVDRIEGKVAYLSDGPASGTEVVAVGGAELYGVEFEVGH